MASQAVRQYLDSVRGKLKGKPVLLSWHDHTLRYHTTPGSDQIDHAVYPVSEDDARAEAKFFGMADVEIVDKSQANGGLYG